MDVRAPVRHWRPDSGPGAVFGDRDAALALLRTAALASRGLNGKGVNVVVVDQGLDGSRIPAKNYGGIIWRQHPYVATPRSSDHGMMVVRNILSVAPEATIFDCHLVPPTISNPRQFASTAADAYRDMTDDIANAAKGLPPGPWIFVNAWAVYSRALESAADNYTNNPDHAFNRIIGETVQTHGRDVIFAAGNCGEFYPNPRCGSDDCGPGRSIHGANAHPRVITAGAVRTDGVWIGSSSQGPGPANMAREKPDLCAPSQFRETGDAFAINTGTSTACGLVAGVVAALRTTTSTSGLREPPGELKARLLATARRGAGAGWDHRLGYGILDVEAALA